MKRVLVTGANGYIGRHVVKSLLDYGYEVYACDLRFEGIDKRAKLIYTPIFNNDENIYKKVGEPDICIHLAWRDGFVHNSDTHLKELSNHYIFLKNMINGGAKHISVMGSMHEVGYHVGAINEDTPTKPLSLYGIAKNALREVMEIETKNNNVVFQWLRAYYIIGDEVRGNSIFSKIYKMEQSGKEYFPFTTGKNEYDFITIEELANQIALSSTQKEITGIINCCSGKPISLAEKAEQYIKDNNFKIKLQYGVFSDRPYDSPTVWGDNTKIKKILANYNKKVN